MYLYRNSKYGIKRLISMILVCIMLCGCIIAELPAMTVKAATSSSGDDYDDNITIDNEGNWQVTFYDKVKTSDIYYSTEGFVLHYTDANGVLTTGNLSETETHMHFETETKSDPYYVNGVQYVTTTKTITADQVKSLLAAMDTTGALLAAYEAGNYSTLRYDSLMAVTDGTTKTTEWNSATQQFEYNTSFGSTASQKAALAKKFIWTDDQGVKHTSTVGDLLNGMVNSFGVFNLYNEEDLAAIQKMYGWSAATLKAFLTHLDKTIQSTNITPDDDKTDDGGKDTGASTDEGPVYNNLSGTLVPNYFTWNVDETGTYDIGDGIPSGENYYNHIRADKWYGVYDWETRSYYYDINVSVTFNGHYTGVVGYHLVIDEEIGGYYAPDYGDISWSHTETVPVRRYYTYKYLHYLDLYGFDGANITNGSFDSNDGVLNTKVYSAQSKITVDATNNGNAVSQVTMTYKDDSHTEKPEDTEKSKDCGYSRDAFPYSDYKALAETLGEVKVWDDTLSINGKTYMTDTKCETTTESVPANAIDVEGDIHGVYDEQKKEVNIPTNTENAVYYTSVDFTYNRLMPLSGPAVTDHTKTNILSGYEQYEPVIVHTPVISPVSITTGNTDASDTQLTNKDQSCSSDWTNLSSDEKYYLLLDHTYTFKWDPWKWLQSLGANLEDLPGYGESGDPSKYDKYVKSKEVRFPFDVEIEGKFYSADNEDVEDSTRSYTDWIELDKADWDDCEFYIPSWSNESTTTFANDAGMYEIQYRVTAYNTIDQFLHDHSGQEEDTMNSQGNPNETGNPDNSSYIATYSVPVNLSGIIYDFQVVGSTNASIYTEIPDDGDFHEQNIAFCSTKQEKRAGTKNRLGGTSVRYTIDGLLTSSWNPLDTIPLSKGRSKQYSDMGGLWQGQTFSFSLRTIANLADSGDSISITPTLRYYTNEGTEYKDDAIQYYYTTKTGKDFIKFGSDSNYMNDVYLGQKQFTDSYYSDDVTYSANKYYSRYDDPEYFYLNNKVSSFSQSHITLKDTLRLLTGNIERLGDNLDKSPSNCKSVEELYGDMTNIIDGDTLLHDSMQTWYGQYWVPNDLFIVETDKLKEAITEKGYSNTDINNDGVTDLSDYVKAYGSISTDADIWQTNGYVMINFDIKSINEGNSHLSYSGMWNTEGLTDSVETGGKHNVTIPVKDGDVAIIEIGNCIQDKYSGRILFID